MAYHSAGPGGGHRRLVRGAYNKLVRFRNQIKNAWHQIDVQLKRRYDLIPNLVEVVKGLHGVRTGDAHQGHPRPAGPALSAEGARGQAKAEGILTETLKSLRRRREVPGAQGEPERRLPAGGADRDGEQDLLRPAVLQRLGDDVQQRDPSRSRRTHRLLLQLRPGGVLRNGTRKPGGAKANLR